VKNNSRNRSHKKSRSSTLRHIQMYVNAHMFTCISLKYSHCTFGMPVHVFYFSPVYISDSWGREAGIVA